MTTDEVVDLRSDTLTQPSAAMREVMATAIVGDDVFGEDPTIRMLEEESAQLMGKERALFVPSGTMGNQLALLAHCQRGDEVLVGAGAHCYLYESGAGAVLAGVQFQVLKGDGHFDIDTLQSAIHGYDSSGHVAPSRLMMIENTHNRGGGKVLAPNKFKGLASEAKNQGLAVHIDGARLWNAAVAMDCSPRAWTESADSITFCLSKGLGAPVGSVLCGSKEFIQRAHRYRKMLGGGMRQAGILAAAGRYALHHHVGDLAKDHERAAYFAEELKKIPSMVVHPVETNIVLFKSEKMASSSLCAELDHVVRMLPFGVGQVRAVFHRDVNDDGLTQALSAIKALLR